MRILQAENLLIPGIAHGFFGRQGGVSQGIFASLNCGPGSGDERKAIAENRRRIAQHFGADTSLLTLHQIHSPKVVTVTAPWPMGEGEEADAMVSAEPNLALAILTADCVPLLFADGEARVIGAAHAGWKGAISGVIEATLTALEQLGAARARIAAAIGPSISFANYEVGAEFRARFLGEDASHARFFTPSDRAGHFRFDLPGYVAARLAAAGVGHVGQIRACTYAQEADFFSFRRSTHRGERDYGRQVSAIMLES